MSDELDANPIASKTWGDSVTLATQSTEESRISQDSVDAGPTSSGDGVG